MPRFVELRAGERLTAQNTPVHARRNTPAANQSLAADAEEAVRPEPGVVDQLLMHKDGNLVAYDADHDQVWASGTRGHPDAVARLDGARLSIRSSTGQELFSGFDFNWQTTKSTDQQGYHYDETSPDWKEACEQLPCFSGLQWPGYQTAVVETTLPDANGVQQDVVVQLWRGRCQRFFGLPDFPGGMGAEVGIYRREPGRSVNPAVLFFRNLAFGGMELAQLRGAQDVWWAAPELGTTLEFSFVNPITQTEIFHAASEQTYWLNRWMYPEDYGRYGIAEGPKQMPQSSSHCILRYSINGVQQPDWGTDAGVGVSYDPAEAEQQPALAA